MKTASRLDHIQPFRVMELLERARQLESAGHGVLHMEVGEPDFPVSAPILAAGRQALDEARTRYTAATGLPELRHAIAGYYEGIGVSVSPERIVITSGASGGLMLLAAALLDPGDRMLVTDPGYPCNDVFAKVVGADVIRVPVTARTAFQPAWTDLQSAWTDSVRGVLLASPANPTGTMIPREGLLEICERLPADAFLIVDEIYQGLVGPKPRYRTALEVSSRPIILQSFSKYFGMTGWRLGWVVIPEELVDGVRRLAQNLYICPPTISQYAAAAAFTPEATVEHERRRWIFRERIERLAEGLKRAGLDVPVMPDGAFYLYADVSSTGLPASVFSRRLLEEFHIAATPGLDFGEYQSERFIRFACTVDVGVIDEVLRRIRAAVDRFRAK